MVIGHDDVEQERKWSLPDDIIEECHAVEQLAVDEDERTTPLFEPTDFKVEHGPLELDRFKLSAEELESWAQRAIRLRDVITKRAARLDTEIPPPNEQNGRDPTAISRGKGCRGCKRSRA